MKTKSSLNCGLPFVWLAVFLIFAISLTKTFSAQSPPDPWPSLPTPLDSWSFNDNTNWTDDYGNPPISFTNIASSELGNGSSLVVETNVPAWLNYPIYATNGATNIILDGPGSICFWYAGEWATTNGGPGEWAQLVDAGEWTSNSSVGYFGLSIDPCGSNVWLFSQDGLGNSYSLSAPIAETTNYFHFIALTYSQTNVSLYLDGRLTTNDPGGLSVWPGTSALQNGVYFGSDTNGNFLADGLFDWVETFGTVLDSNTVAEIYDQQVFTIEIMPWNIPYMDGLSSAPSDPSTNSTTPDVITGAGNLQSDGADSGCSYSTNAYYVWITNIVATPSATSNGLWNVAFSINGGQSSYLYDVFAIGALPVPLSSGTWSWMGQGQACYRYTIPNVNNTDCFLVLGTPQDSDGDGLTDAYELLVSHTNPHNADSNLDGISDGWEILLGLNPLQSNIANSADSLDYTYTSADWIYGVSGIKPASNVIMDNEGNVTQVSQ